MGPHACCFRAPKTNHSPQLCMRAVAAASQQAKLRLRPPHMQAQASLDLPAIMLEAVTVRCCGEDGSGEPPSCCSTNLVSSQGQVREPGGSMCSTRVPAHAWAVSKHQRTFALVQPQVTAMCSYASA